MPSTVLIVNPKPDAKLPEWEKKVDSEYVVMLHEWRANLLHTEFVQIEAGMDLGGAYDIVMEADVAWPTMMINPAESCIEFVVDSSQTCRFRFNNGGHYLQRYYKCCGAIANGARHGRPRNLPSSERRGLH